MTEDNRFLGTGWSFPPSFDWRNKQAVLVSHVQDIEQSLTILLSTVPGERIMQPTYGCGLNRMVFETINESTVTEIKDLVARAVLFFEVRITLNAVQVETGDVLDGVLRLRLDYTIRTTNTRHNMVYPLYLQEGTAIAAAP
jgi:uncharacterized protein